MAQAATDSYKPTSVSDLPFVGTSREMISCRRDSIVKDSQNVPYPVLQCVDILLGDWASYDQMVLTESAIQKIKNAAKYSCPIRIFAYSGTESHPCTSELWFLNGFYDENESGGKIGGYSIDFPVRSDQPEINRLEIDTSTRVMRTDYGFSIAIQGSK